MKTGLPEEKELRLETRFQAARMGERSSPSGRQRSVLLRAKVCPFAPGGVLAAVVARAAVSGSAAVWRGKPVPGVGDGCFCSVLCPFLLCFALFAANACRCFPVFRVVLSAFSLCCLLLGNSASRLVQGCSCYWSGCCSGVVNRLCPSASSFAFPLFVDSSVNSC